MERKTGLLHYYYGDGKGKTTAALGLCLREAGAGGRVLVAQFLKGSPYSELAALKTLGVAVFQTAEVKKFVFQMNDEEKAATKADCAALLSLAEKALCSGEYDLVVLDEATDAVSTGMLEESALLAALDHRAEKTETVVTGHIPNEAVVSRADYVTEMKKQKHPYDRGILARRGIEF